MFKKKKKLYEDKKYFLLALSILSDIAITMGVLVLPFIFIAVRLHPSLGEGVGLLWLFTAIFSLYVGIPAKIIDTLCVKCLNYKIKLIKYGLLLLNLICGIITVIFWVFIIWVCFFG